MLGEHVGEIFNEGRPRTHRPVPDKLGEVQTPEFAEVQVSSNVAIWVCGHSGKLAVRVAQVDRSLRRHTTELRNRDAVPTSQTRDAVWGQREVASVAVARLARR